jgi:phosphatidylserine/phosphatidylglycerophosphate/cardiolipin synthase-like enzyme
MLTLAALLTGCAAPDLTQGRSVFSAAPVRGTTAVNDAFIATIEGAEERLRIALPTLTDPALAAAIEARHVDGLDVEVVTDQDQADDPGVIALLDAGVPVQLADGSVTYFDFNLNQDVAWNSEDVAMTNAFVVADSIRVTAADRAGDEADGYRVVVEATNQWIAEDLEAEHNQLMGGTDAASLTAFSSLAKSILDARWAYHTEDDVTAELWFGPQERLIKRLIDATYRAQSSIWVLTGELQDEGLARALQAKAANGFDVQVIVGPEHVNSIFGPSVVLARETPDVLKYRSTLDGPTPTVVVVDYAPDRDGIRRTTQAFVLTHPIVSAARLFQDSEVATDQLMDGTLWVLRELDDPSEELESLVELQQVHLDTAEVL